MDIPMKSLNFPARCLVGLLFLFPSLTFAAGVLDNYALSTNDAVKVEVFQEPEMTISARVTKEGTVTVPLIGQVKIAGLTPSNAAEKIRVLLEKDYFNNPSVSVSVLEFTKRRFVIFGEVRSPGTHEFPAQEDLNLVQAIAMCGGYTKIANPGNITVVRRSGGKEETFKLDARKMSRDSKTKPFLIQPDDVITVGESFL
jgi:polysaccharide export outer membrane protein